MQDRYSYLQDHVSGTVFHKHHFICFKEKAKYCFIVWLNQQAKI